MALEKQIVNVDLGRGIDSKRDEATVQGNLVLLQNGEFDKVGSINKRLPFELLSVSATTPDTLLPAATKLMPFKKSINAVTDRQSYATNPNRVDAPNEIFYYDAQRDNYDRYTGCQSAVMQSFPIMGDIGENNQYQIYDSVSKNNLTYHMVLSFKLGGVFLIVTNSLDESVSYYAEIASFLLDVNCGRLLLLGNTLVMLYSNTTDANLRMKTLNTGNLVDPTISSTTTLATDLAANRTFDATTNADGTKFFVAYNSTTANTTKIFSHNGTAVVNTATIADDSDQAISVAYESTVGPSLLVVYANNANELRSENFSDNLSASSGNFLISAEAVAIAGISVNGNKASFSVDGWPILWTLSGTVPNLLTKSALISTSAVLDAARSWCRGLAISSKIFYFNNQHYVFGVYSSELQTTFYLLHLSGYGADLKHRVIGRYFAGQARVSHSYTSPPNVGAIGSTIRYMSIANKFFRPISYVPSYGDSLYEIVFYLTDVRNFSSIEAANNSHVVGSMLSMYDGVTHYEHGFNHYPESPTLVASVGAGALTLTGVYQYVIVFEWIDQFGQTHRSAPSVPVSITLAGAQNTVTLTIPTYKISNRHRSNNLIYKVFRTSNLGSTFQEVARVAHNAAVDAVTYPDVLSDASLASRAFLYTTGGVLESVAALPSWAVTLWKKRVCLLTESGVQYSKKITDGNPVEFSDAFLIALDTIGGRGTGIGVLDDKLIVFKTDRIYYVTGEGPNDTGTVGQFSDPVSIASDVGCINPKSVVNTDKGIIFQSTSGFCILLRNLTVVYIGSNVEYFTNNSPVVTASLLVEAKSQVRFLTEAGECLVYDYLIEQWSVFTNHIGQDVALFNNKAVRINSSRNVVIETPNVTFVDHSNTEYTLKMRTSWLSFAELQGFMRVYRLLLYGKFKSHHILQVKVAYDYNPKVIDTYSFNTNAAGKSLTVIPDGAIYGDTVFSGADIYQMRAHLSRQKCEAIQLTIEDTSLSGTKESYSLTNLAFEIGVKGPVFKKPAAFSNV